MHKGFTLIELVMVIVILGIVSALAIPRFVGLQESAANASAEKNVAVIRTAISNYYAEHAAMGSAAFPPAITTDLFMDGQLPVFTTPYSYTYNSTSGVVQKTSS